MMLTNGTGQATIYDNEDKNEAADPCQQETPFDVSCSVGLSNQCYTFFIQDAEPLAAVIDGNTLTPT